MPKTPEKIPVTYPSPCFREITHRQDYRSPGRLEYRAKVEKCQGMKKAQGHTPNNRRESVAWMHVILDFLSPPSYSYAAQGLTPCFLLVGATWQS